MSQLDGYIQKYAKKFGVRPDILARMIFQESSNDPNIRGPMTSQGRGMGLGQAMPNTARQPGHGVAALKDPFDPEENVRFTAEYLAMNLEKFGGDYALAIAGYHSGPTRVERLLAQNKNILDMPKQFPNTVKHVDRILGKRNKDGIRPFLAVAEPEVTLEVAEPAVDSEAEAIREADADLYDALNQGSGIKGAAATGVNPRLDAIAAAVMEATKDKKGDGGFRAMEMGLGMLDKDIQPMLEQLSSLQVPERSPNPMDRFSGGIASLKDSAGNMFRMRT
tara:strand:- start:80 stop:913 length:834 start_codon:yes stop_codon:yes gene_type:complete